MLSRFPISFIVIPLIFLGSTYYYPKEYQIEKFRVIKQTDGITCGPACCAMVLNHYDKKVTVDQVKERTATSWFSYEGKEIGMTAPEFIPLAMDSFGVSVEKTRGSIQSLRYYVSQDKPVIILLRSTATTWHYIVVIGYTEEKVIYAEPDGGGKIKEMDWNKFEGAWKFTSDMLGNELESDWLYFMIKFAGVKGYTMFVPKFSR